MFRKPPLKTYQRKKAGGALSTSNLNSIIREYISENKELQPKEFLAFNDNEKSLEYDPFDTTFDRLARDPKYHRLPSILPNQADDTSYSSSSSNTKNSLSDDGDSEPLPDPLPLINPKPTTRRRNYKKQKVNEKVAIVRVQKLEMQVENTMYKNDSSMDENTEPNARRAKRGRKKKDSKKPRSTPVKKRRVAEKPATSTYKEKTGKNVSRSKSLQRCSVSLTRISIPLDKSMAALNLDNDILNSKQICEESAAAEPSKAEIQGEVSEVRSTSLRDEMNWSSFKNPIVSLTRLNVPQSWSSIANKNWLNSTPINRRITRPKSSLHFSPINTDVSMVTTGHNEDGDYDRQSLPSKKSFVQSKDLTPKNSNISKPSDFSEQHKKNSRNNTPRILSISSDPEPSGLMFEDNDIPSPFTDFYDNLAESGNKDVTAALTISPFKGFSKNSAKTFLKDSQPTFQAVLAPIGNYSNATEAPTANPFKGFKNGSTDSESLHLAIEGGDKTGVSSKELTCSPEKTSTENRTDESNAAFSNSFVKYQQNNAEESAKNRQINLEESANDQLNISEEGETNRQNSLEENVKDRQNISKEIAKDWQNYLEESAKDTSEKTNSDDEWATTLDSPRSDSSDEKIPENTTADISKCKSIVEVSSDDNTSCDDIGEFVNASESSSRMKFDSQVSTSFEAEENLKVGSISNNIAKAEESSVVEITYHKKLCDDPRRTSIQPMVVLTRLSVPVRKPRTISNVKNTRLKSPSDSMKSILELSSENGDTDVEKSANESEIASESMEWEGSGNEESQESQDDIRSLKIEGGSGNTTEVEKSPTKEISEPDLTNGSFQWSMTELGNVNGSFSTKIEVGDNRNEEENLEAAEASVKKSLDEDTSEEKRRSVQPIVLLTRLNDPIRVTERRKKYHNWGLDAISQNLAVENVMTIEEELEETETTDTIKNQKKKEEFQKGPKIKLSGDENTKTGTSQETTESWNTSVLSNEGRESIREDKIVFLKPGKSWSRSLSLFRQVHSQDDIELLAVGKGKKWRQSVQSILDMQHEGVIQSCFKKNEDDKESRSCYGARNSAATWNPGCSQSDTSRVFSQSSVGSPGRFVRRVSIRVVPDGKNSDHYEDSPFLEAYGITSSEIRKTLGKRSTLIAPRNTLVYNVQCEDVTLESISKSLNSVTSRDVVLAQCCQDSSVPFDEFYPDSYLKQCRKIGEGVFGEVFLYEKSTMRNVIKIIPIEGELKVNGERQKKFDEILSEIVIAKELNNLRFSDTCKTSSFVEVKNIRCVIGKYPRKLIDLWKIYDDEKNSENDCPDMFDKNQLYIVLELGHGGQDLEAFVFQNSSEAHALFIQTALALAVAEESLEFEHRDLHWGNILISRTEDSKIDYKLRNKDISVASKGVKVSVIDFTLSRMSYQGCSIFNDLSLDDDLFAAQGEYQFEIYRLMRQKVKNNWQTFEPYTNILWLHYTLDKMITAVRYRRTSSKIHKNGISKLNELKNEILDYKSAFDFVTNCDNVTRLQGSLSSVPTVASTD